MNVFIDNEGNIIDIGITKDKSLTKVVIDKDNDDRFKGWSDLKFLCYKLNVQNGEIIGYSPIVPYSTVTKLETVGQEIIELKESIIEIAGIVYGM